MREVFLVLTGRPDVLPLLAHDDGGAGVLAHRQDTTGGDVGVLEQIKGDEPIIGAGLGVIENAGELLEVRGAQQVGDVLDALVGEQS